jgi:lysophospholipase L1-like esterase
MNPLQRFQKYSRFAVLLLTAALVNTEAHCEVIASFWQMAITDNAPEGWRVAWNPDGPLEDMAKYSDLSAVKSKKPGERRVMQRGVLDGNGTFRDDAPNLSSNGVAHVPENPADGQKRYLIASYTMPRDSVGSVWINDGNIQNKNVVAGVELKIFLNGALVKDLTASMARVPTLFQQALGPLKKGDTVSVAVGPAKLGERATGALRYTLEESPGGKSPAPPQNTFHLPIDAYGPQYDPDGTCAVYEAKQAAFNETLLARKPELVFLGDSITSRWPQELLEKHFGAYRPVNLGVGGDRVQNVIWRLQRTSLEATPLKALVLLIGTNNVSSAFPPEETAGGIQKLVKMVEEKAPEAKILILGVFPRGPAIHAPKNASVDALNAKLKDLADGKKVFYLDVGPSLAEPDGSISLEVMPDKLHVALPGFLRWMDAMKPTLQSLLPNRPQEATATSQDPG